MQKKLNLKKLLKTDFVDRLIGFVEKDDDIYNSDFSSIIQGCIDSKDFDTIYSFLKITYSENLGNTNVPISIHQLISMSSTDFEYYKEYYSKVSELNDEGVSLYKELLSFYE